MAERRAFPIGLTIAVAVALSILLALGTWQLQRRAWKADLLSRIAALEASPPRPTGPVLDAAGRGEDVDFTRVSVTCPGLARAPFLELYGLREGQAGARLISACRVDSLRYRTVLVDRGFVADTISARPPVDPADRTPVSLVGVLRQPEPATAFSPPNTPRRWFTRDAEAMATALGARDPAPLFLMAETSSNPEWKGLTPAPIPAAISNRHMEYALTWYGLAAALVGVYAAMLFRRRKT